MRQMLKDEATANGILDEMQKQKVNKTDQTNSILNTTSQANA